MLVGWNSIKLDSKLIRILAIWGRRWTRVHQCPPKTTSKDSAGPWKFFKRSGSNFSESLTWRVRGIAISHCVQACHFLCSLDIILFTQFIWKEIWSSINCLFFISTSWIYGMNEQIRQDIMWPKGLKDVLGPEQSWTWGCLILKFVTRRRGLLLRVISCPELLPVKNCYKPPLVRT